MSDEAGAVPQESGFAEIHEALQRMRSSSRTALPMMLLGLTLTLAAAGVAIYYIVTLRGSNATLAAALDDSRAALLQSQEAQARALPLLEAARGATPADTNRIRRAIGELHRGVETLESAEQGLAVAEQSLPTEGVSAAPAEPVAEPVEPTAPANGAATQPDAPAQAPAPPERILPPVLPGRAFAVLGSFAPDESGLRNAFAFAATVQRQGACVEIWRANTSNHYAVVLGGVTSVSEARERARQARAAGYAPDAYSQFDRGWTRVERSPQC